MTRLIIACLLIAFSAHTPAEDANDFPGVRGLMSAQEFEDAGLNKISDAEREALDDWLVRYTAWEAPAIRKTVEEVKAVEKELEILANIKQPFKGWSSKTYFYLDNGQVWQQRTAERYYYSGENTAIRITKNILGFYSMEHLVTGEQVNVKRLR